MSTIAERTRITPDDLLAMEDGKRFELVNGELVEREMGALSSLVAGRLLRQIANFAEERHLGWPFDAECGYRCFEEPARVRRPDVSFISQTRLAADEVPDGYLEMAPDLAVEVVSPNDLFYEVEEKVGEYLRAGVRLVWVVNPRERSVQVYRLDGSAARLGAGAELSGEQVLPGFRCPVADLFPGSQTSSESTEPEAR